MYQGNDIVAVYYTKMKRLWDELADLSEIPVCACAQSCEAMKKSIELAQRQKLMQFLMHLNEDYEAIRGQILLMYPLPSVSKACLMIERVEQQRVVTAVSSHTDNAIAAAVNTGGFTTSVGVTDHSSSGFLAKGSSGPRFN